MRYGELLVDHAGLVPRAWLANAQDRARVQVNKGPWSPDAVPAVGDDVRIDGAWFEVVAGGGEQRLQVIGKPASESARITGRVRAHCGYHKAMTEFSKKVYRKTCRAPWWRGQSFRHFFHRVDAFYAFATRYSLCSISGHVLDLDRFDDIRVVRVVRDPRDLLISGYHYHRRSAEHWCDLVSPTDLDWTIVDGTVPSGLPAGMSLAAWLADVPLETGLAAEFEFRARHFQSLRDWPDDPRVLTLRYEDILGDEARQFGRVAEFLELPRLAGWAMQRFAHRYRASGQTGKRGHVRDARKAQWRDVMSTPLVQRFAREYGDVLDRYGYPRA